MADLYGNLFYQSLVGNANLQVHYERIRQRPERYQQALIYLAWEVSQGTLTSAAAIAFLNDMDVSGTVAASRLEKRYYAGNNGILDFLNNTGGFTTATGWASKTTTYGGTGAAANTRKAVLLSILND